MESWKYLFNTLSTSESTGLESPPTTLVEDLYGAVIVKSGDLYDRIYIGKNSLEAGGSLITTTNASRVNPDELFLYKQPGKNLREPNLAQLGIQQIIPIAWENGQIDFITHKTTENNGTTYAALHIHTNNGVRTLQMDVSELIGLFHPSNEVPPLIEFLERGETEKSKFALVLQNPEDKSQAFLLFVEDREQINSSYNRAPTSRAMTTDILSTISQKTQEIYGGAFPKILINVRNRRDYRNAEDSMLQKLMELQALAYYFNDAQNQGLWNAEMLRFQAKWIGEISLQRAKYQILDPYQDYPTVPRSFDPGEEHVIYQSLDSKTSEIDESIANEAAFINTVSALLGSIEDKHSLADLKKWIESLSTLSMETENLQSIQAVILAFDNYAVHGGSRDSIVGTSKRQKSIKEILYKKSRELRLQLITDIDIWAEEINFEILDFCISYPAKIPVQSEDANVFTSYIQKLYEIGSGEERTSDLYIKAMERLNSVKEKSRGKTLLTSKTYDGFTRSRKESVADVATDAILALASETL